MSPGPPRPETSAVRMSFISDSWSARGRGVGQQRHLPRVLHRDGDVALVLAAVAGDPAGTDLAAVGDVLPKERGGLGVDRLEVSLLLRLPEHANLLLGLANGWLGHGWSPESVSLWVRVRSERGLVAEAAAAASAAGAGGGGGGPPGGRGGAPRAA